MKIMYIQVEILYIVSSYQKLQKFKIYLLQDDTKNVEKFLNCDTKSVNRDNYEHIG